MKLEARTDRLQLTLQTTTLETHAVMTDHREAVQLALDRAAAWFKLEVDRLVVGNRLARQFNIDAPPPFNPDPLHEFRPEQRP